MKRSATQTWDDACVRSPIVAVLLAGTAAVVPASTGKLARYTRVLGVTLERTTLRRAVKLLGPAEIRYNEGDAHASQYSVCYRGDDGTVLVYGSHGEMGGTAHYITEVQIAARADLAEYGGDAGYKVPPSGKPACSRLPALSRSLALGGRLRLGASRESVSRLLQPDSRTDASVSASATIPVGEDYVTMRTVTVVFEADHAVVLRAYQVTSN